MSRGPGSIMTAALGALAEHHRDRYITGRPTVGLTLDAITTAALAPSGPARWSNPSWRNARDSMARALRQLECRRAIVRHHIPGHTDHWELSSWTPSADDDRQRAEQTARERRARAEAEREAEQRREEQARERAEAAYRRARERMKLDAGNASPKRLAKLLGLLGSAHEHERLAAAKLAEEERARLGRTWHQLLTER